MSPGDSGDHVTLLRSAIARIEALGGGQAHGSANPPKLRLGERLELDKALGGGIADGSLSEVMPASFGDMAAACGFVLALAARLAGACGRTLIWILEDFAATEHGAPYGPGLLAHGIAPANLVLVRVPRGEEALWALEAALKTRSTVVIGELWAQHRLYDLTASRRLAVAARASGSPGLILHGRAGQAPASAAATRFEIASHASTREPSAARRLPVPGPPAWCVRITKSRAGPDPERCHLIVWNPEKGCFCDALPLHPPAQPAHRPYRTVDAALAKTG